jgi:hypothetical protein
MVNLKNKNSFKKDSPKKLIPRRNMQPVTFIRRGYKGKIYIKET